ncbi:hypothetical protein EBU24_07025, partial [bacterium]|nr:hypothetical protein [bacterium]
EITPPTKDFFKTNLEAKLTSFQKLHEHGTKKIIEEFGLKGLIKCEFYQTIAIAILNYYTNIYNQLKDNEQMSIHNVPFAYNSHIKWTSNIQAMKLYHVAVWSIIERLQTTLHMILNHEHINIKDTRNYLCTRTILTDILDKKTN